MTTAAGLAAGTAGQCLAQAAAAIIAEHLLARPAAAAAQDEERPDAAAVLRTAPVAAVAVVDYEQLAAYEALIEVHWQPAVLGMPAGRLPGKALHMMPVMAAAAAAPNLVQWVAAACMPEAVYAADERPQAAGMGRMKPGMAVPAARVAEDQAAVLLLRVRAAAMMEAAAPHLKRWAVAAAWALQGTAAAAKTVAAAETAVLARTLVAGAGAAAMVADQQLAACVAVQTGCG